MTLNMARLKRNDALSHARNFARRENWTATVTWLERAAKFMPLTPMQAWRFRMIMGDDRFFGLKISRFVSEDANPVGKRSDIRALTSVGY